MGKASMLPFPLLPIACSSRRQRLRQTGEQHTGGCQMGGCQMGGCQMGEARGRQSLTGSPSLTRFPCPVVRPASASGKEGLGINTFSPVPRTTRCCSDRGRSRRRSPARRVSQSGRHRMPMAISAPAGSDIGHGTTATVTAIPAGPTAEPMALTICRRFPSGPQVSQRRHDP